MKIFYLLIFFTWSINVWAGARPITYNVSMDYNAITDQFENARITGGVNSNIIVNSSVPIKITTAKDGVIGLNYRQAGNGNQQISVYRQYSLFNLTLQNVVNSYYKVTSSNILASSRLNVLTESGVNYGVFGGFNNGCQYSNIGQDSFLNGNLLITSFPNSQCVSQTAQINTAASNITFNHIIQPSETAMEYNFDINNNIKSYLRNSAAKIGKYIGSVTYRGDSVFSRVGGAFTESYTFNFTINKVASLNAINFPNGKISNIIVKKINSNFVGNSELNFNVNGVFNFDNKLNFQLTSANTINDKLILKNGNNSIPYNVKLTNITTGKQKLFTQSGQVQSLKISSNDQFQGVLGFSFSVPSSDTPNGNYSDQLTMIVSLDI
ncbi:hypothetical protein [Photobacterium damselae]|uniref:hypothetical protein n=1 Tax=Photobacterium damselae TaxID=38293 RepID=UPI001F469C35|nr:hypothetical protein [Photobacterium damselae]UKA12075.1 hypothetical protein IHC91_20125 [Photobacterium damselae subsp. damselae]